MKCNFLEFSFFAKVSTDIKMLFYKPYENYKQRSKYQFFLLILKARLLYALCCGGPSIMNRKFNDSKEFLQNVGRVLQTDKLRTYETYVLSDHFVHFLD